MRAQRPTLPDSDTTMLVRCPPTMSVTVTGKLVEGVDSTTRVRCAASYLIQLGSGLSLLSVALTVALLLPGWLVTDSGRLTTKALPPLSTACGTTTLTKPAAAELGSVTTDTLTLAVFAGVPWAVVALVAGRAVALATLLVELLDAVFSAAALAVAPAGAAAAASAGAAATGAAATTSAGAAAAGAAAGAAAAAGDALWATLAGLLAVD